MNEVIKKLKEEIDMEVDCIDGSYFITTDWYSMTKAIKVLGPGYIVPLGDDVCYIIEDVCDSTTY